MNVFLNNLKNFFCKFFDSVFSIGTFIVGGLAYLLGYPAKMTILTMVLVFFVLDFATRFYAIKVQNGGLFKALVAGKFSSKSFINGFITKIIAYFTILVSANFAEITPQLSFIGDGIAAILYVGLFFYELISNMENLIEAGLNWLKPLLDKIKKKQDGFLKDDKSDKESAITAINNPNNEIKREDTEDK
jgi:phage-related holin